MYRKNILFLFVLLTFSAYSQIERKTLKATRIQESPKIDGILDDSVWDSLPIHGGFSMFEPGTTEKERDTHRTQVKLAYDDKAIYIAAYLFDNEPHRVLKQFSQRDQVFVQADYFSVNINTLDDGINETVFYVTSAGTIGDSRKENNGEDFNFNVVFQCNTSMDEKGWYAEFKIPYNALRFPELEVQNWSINFFRRITHLNEIYVWNHINREVGFATQYSGEVTGLTNIDPPLRLILFPFVQGAVFASEDATETDLSAGMDIKYGLSDNFTLDATLIPDFGQAAFDNVELNLGPFEQVFSENRQFFTEGIELFERGGLFFSRRVGGNPTRRGRADDDLADSEKVIENPENVNLINAVKVSGRTQGNLGIGFFNSVTEPTKAVIQDTVTGATREFITESLANYNIVVLDQQFNKNSSVSFINTNVTRSGDFRDANVTGLIYNISNRANSYNYEGGVRLSTVKDGTTQNGIRTNFEIRKTKGNFRWFLGHFMADQNYEPNDLGLLFRNNFNNFAGNISYQIFQPRGIFNEYRITLRANHRRLFRPSVTTRNSLSMDAFFVTPERFAFGGDIGYNGRNNDFFEPRVTGRFVTFSSNLGGRAWVSSDYRKKFAYDADITYRNWFEDPQTRYSFSLSPRYRFSDKFLLIWSSEFSKSDREFGYVDDDDVDVFLGERDVTILENSLRASFNFDSYKALNLRFRNFWSTASYEDDAYFILNQDGSRAPTSFDTSENNPNTNFNIWNFDLSFNWRFSPGSEAVLLYRNSIFNEDNNSGLNYLDSLNNLFQQNINHTLSLRIVYFLDINNIGGSFKG